MKQRSVCLCTAIAVVSCTGIALAGGGPGGPGDPPNPPNGACCGMDGTCADDVGLMECFESGGFPAPGATCADIDCSAGPGEPPAGACCDMDGGCADDVSFFDCLDGGGFPAPGATCAGVDCTGGGGPGDPPNGACCAADDTCVDDVPFIECLDDGGFPAPGATCAEIDCRNGGIPNGACCDQDTCADDVPFMDCIEAGGLPAPEMTCADIDCVSAPQIVHSDGTDPCSGFIDPRAETYEEGGAVTSLGLTSADIRFNVPVYGTADAGAVTIANFELTNTGGIDAPVITSASMVNGDSALYRVEWSQPIALQQWTTLRAEVFNADGVAIENHGDRGPGENEPDRIDLGSLPGDVDQNGRVEPFDLLHLRQLLNGDASDTCGPVANYVDMDRDGSIAPFDLLRFRQLIQGMPPAAQPWQGASIALQP